MISHTLQSLLNSCAGPNPRFPPTLLYNEGWMLRLILDWFSKYPDLDHPLAFPRSGTWFSEALLPSPFLPRFRGDPLAESRTHADGIIGHINIGKLGKADVELLPNGTHFVVCEAKIFSSLSGGVKNVTDYGQAARNVACIVETLRRAGVDPEQMDVLGFYVLAPNSQIEAGTFAMPISKAKIQQQIELRVQQYQGSKDVWFRDWFCTIFPKVIVQAIAWEALITFIRIGDPAYGGELQGFYERCLVYNQASQKRKQP